ncbi:hypothetical protein [Neochlamydia sp. S13]|uniref:hypothetical protein n=1 Tax=Neochlamydia sp. S13 TaxID=1353976 RepID=UPI00102E6592|nr:hypothetical protein [Neochlamydia sp. S13]
MDHEKENSFIELEMKESEGILPQAEEQETELDSNKSRSVQTVKASFLKKVWAAKEYAQSFFIKLACLATIASAGIASFFAIGAMMA